MKSCFCDIHIPSLFSNVIKFLTKFFPNIQFVITTHSPFVLNSIENSVVYDILSVIK